MYANIDMVKTGKKICELIYKNGYTVKEIQDYLELSCPQPIYRWFKGQILPSVNNLYNLSLLLNVHMEDLLVRETAFDNARILDFSNIDESKKYILIQYLQAFCDAA